LSAIEARALSLNQLNLVNAAWLIREHCRVVENKSPHTQNENGGRITSI
jgi:hypothetical protein